MTYHYGYTVGYAPGGPGGYSSGFNYTSTATPAATSSYTDSSGAVYTYDPFSQQWVETVTSTATRPTDAASMGNDLGLTAASVLGAAGGQWWFQRYTQQFVADAAGNFVNALKLTGMTDAEISAAIAGAQEGMEAGTIAEPGAGTVVGMLVGALAATALYDIATGHE